MTSSGPWGGEFSKQLLDSRHSPSDPVLLQGIALVRPELDDLCELIGASALALDAAEVTTTADGVHVVGTTTLFGIKGVGVQVAFGANLQAPTVALKAKLPAERRLQLAGLPWASIGDLSFDAVITGPTIVVPTLDYELAGTFLLPGQPAPVAVSMRTRLDGPGWRLRATDIALPGPATVAHLFGVEDAGALVPSALSGFDGFSITELLCDVRPDDWAVDALAVTIGAEGKEWAFDDHLPTLHHLSVHIELRRDQDDTGRGNADLLAFGSMRPSVSLSAKLTHGTIELPVTIAWAGNEWLFAIEGAHGFPSVGEIVEMAAGSSAAQSLPAALRKLRMDEATVRLTATAADAAVRTIFFGARLDEHWPLIEGHLSLERVALEVFVDRASGDSRGYVTGAIRLGEFELPVCVRKPGGSAPWTLELGGGASHGLAGLSSLDGLSSGVSTLLPAGMSAGPVTLNRLSIAFDAINHCVTSIDVEVSAPGPWQVPELREVGIHDVSMKLSIVSPGDSELRQVNGSIRGTADLGGPELAIELAREVGAANWVFRAELTARSPLGLSTLAKHAAPGSLSPDGMPDFALTSATLAVTPGTGEVVLKAASAGPWPLAVGFSGLHVGALALDLRRAPGTGNITGHVSGRIGLDGAELTVDYSLPGELVLSGHLDSLHLRQLVDVLVGPGLVDGLSIPQAVKDFELRDLDVSLTPGRGQFAASANVASLGTAAVMVHRSDQGTWGFAVAVLPSPSWRLSSLYSGLHFADALTFESSVLIVSTADHFSSVLEHKVVKDRLGASNAVTVDHGLTLIADMALADTAVEKLLTLVGQPRAHLRVCATISECEFALAAQLGGPLKLCEGVVLTNADLHVRSQPTNLAIGFAASMDVTLAANETLHFEGAFELQTNEVYCAVTMTGKWTDPFGATGVEIADVAIALGISYQGVPNIGLSGHLSVGSFHGTLAFVFEGGDPSQSMICLAFDRLRLGDVLTSLCHEVFHDAVPEALVQTVFDVTFEDVEIYVVPRDTTIGKVAYKAGMRFAARVNLWGLQADARVEIDHHTGLVIKGDVDPIKLGEVFELCGTTDHSKASLHLEVTQDSTPTIDVSGEVRLLGLRSKTELHLTDKGFHFETTGTIFDLFMCHLEARGGHLGDTNGFYVEVSMANDLFEYLREHATKALEQAAKDADNQFRTAQITLQTAHGDVAKLNDQIADRRRTIEQERSAIKSSNMNSQQALATQKQQTLVGLRAQYKTLLNSISGDRVRDTQRLAEVQGDLRDAQRDVDTAQHELDRVRAFINAERDVARRRMAVAQAGVEAAQGNVNSILRTIQDKENWWRSLPDVDLPWNESKARAGVWYGPMVAGLYTGYGVATGALQIANGVLEGIAQGARFTPVEMDPRYAGVAAGYGVATGGLTVAKAAVSALQFVQTLPPVETDPRLEALDASVQVAQAAFDVALIAVRAAQSGLDVIPIELDPVIVTLTASREAADLALSAASGIVEATRVTVGAALTVSEYIADYGLGGLIDVRRASFAASLDAAHEGKIRLSVDLQFMKTHKQHAEFQFDFKSPLDGVQKLVAELLKAA